MFVIFNVQTSFIGIYHQDFSMFNDNQHNARVKKQDRSQQAQDSRHGLFLLKLYCHLLVKQSFSSLRLSKIVPSGGGGCGLQFAIVFTARANICICFNVKPILSILKTAQELQVVLFLLCSDFCVSSCYNFTGTQLLAVTAHESPLYSTCVEVFEIMMPAFWSQQAQHTPPVQRGKSQKDYLVQVSYTKDRFI